MDLKCEMDLLMELESFAFQSYDKCNCYKNIVLTNMFCYQPTSMCNCLCFNQPKNICLNRTMKYDLLQLQKAYADLHKDSMMAAKIDRKINAFESREFKQGLKSIIRDKIASNRVTALRKNERPLTRPQKVLLRGSFTEKLDFGRCMKLLQKKDEKYKTKEVRKKTVTLEMTMAKIEFEKAKLKKLEDEEKRKERSVNNIKPKKKGPKTHFRKSKKPGRA